MTRGTKRKIEIEKRETKQQRSVACSKRRKTVFSKAADLCLHAGANIAVFVTSPVQDSDVVYSFSGYSSASEIAHCYLNAKSPPPIPDSNLGFLSEDPVDLYRHCDDLSELDVIEERLLRMKSDILACIDRKRKLQKNPCFEEKPCPESLCFDQNPSSVERPFEESICFDQNPSFAEKPFAESFCFDQNPCLEEKTFAESFCFDQNSSFVEKENPFQESICFDQNPSSEERPFAESLCFDQNPSPEENPLPESFCFDQTPSFEEKSLPEIFCFDQNPSFVEKPFPESFCFDQNPSFVENPFAESFCFDQNLGVEEKSFTESFCFDQNPSSICLATEEEAAEAYRFVEAIMNTSFGALHSHHSPSSSDHNNLQQLPPSDLYSCGIPFESSSLLCHHQNIFQQYPASTVQVPMWANQSY